MKRVACLSTFLCVFFCCSLQAEEVPTELNVKGAKPLPASVVEVEAVQSALPPARDTGEFLRSVPGVTAGRMGGHGVDPVIRGQKNNQLNIVKDGSYIFGGCPNRMDPPASLLTVDEFSTVRVLRGYDSVQNGPGASGGVVSIDNVAPQYDPTNTSRTNVSSLWDSNGSFHDHRANSAYIDEKAYARIGGFWKDSDNYEDGDGEDVRSAFRMFGGKFIAGLTPSDKTHAMFGFDIDTVEDALFAGAGMDAPLTDTYNFRIKADHELDGDVLKKVRFNAFYSIVNHIMDNYSLRPRTMSFSRVSSDSDTYGGKIIGDFKVGQESIFSLGAELLTNDRDAGRYSNPMNRNAVNTLQSLLWPDVSIQQLGFFGELETPVAPAFTLRTGLRYDHVDVDAGDAGVAALTPDGLTPNDLYQLYYGTTADYDTEHNIGALARLEYELNHHGLVHFGVSRAVRTADATERALANNNMMMGRWIGNPGIDPEVHYQVDTGVSYSGSSWYSAFSLYYDDVDDYILRDRARGQDGILLSDASTIYRNIDAYLSGAEAEFHLRVFDGLMFRNSITYTRGNNETDGQALAQIPPFFGRTELVWETDQYDLGTRVRYAAKQTRVDDDPTTGSGLDARQTPGYGVVDLFANARVIEGVELRAGISNIFDKTYANHLNRSNSFDPIQVQVNEPGRSFFIQARATF